jgi:hypothetical protein
MLAIERIVAALPSSSPPTWQQAKENPKLGTPTQGGSTALDAKRD